MSWKKWKKNPMLKAGLLGGALTAGTALSGGTLPVAVGVGLAGAGLYQQYKNYSSQQKNLEYQMETQREAFEREDNSVGRRVADLQAAGLSPVLAAGQGAGTGPIVSTKPPQMDNPLTPVADVLGLLKMKEDITNTLAQRELIKAQTNFANIGASAKNWDLTKFKEYNLPSNASGLAKTVRDIFSLTGSPIIQSTVKELKDKANSRIEYNKAVENYNRAKEKNEKLLRQKNEGKRWYEKSFNELIN